MREQRVQQPPSQALFLVCRIHTDGVNLVLGRVTPQPEMPPYPTSVCPSLAAR